MSVRRLRAALLALAASAILIGACADGERVPPRGPKTPPCPPPPEPAYQAAVVGTIGKLHLVESRYPLSKLGDVLATFKPDLVLVAVRVDPFRAGHLEDASFEMTYVTALAKKHGIAVEPVDWFREQDLAAPATPAEPWDASEILKREAEVLARPRLYTFEQANAGDLAQKVLLARAAEARYRSGDPITTRRHAWMQQLAASAVERHGRPKRVLAYVDVLDRPAIDLLLHGVGYATKQPVELVSKAKEEMIGGLSPDLLDEWKAQSGRAQSNAEIAKTPVEKAFWADREKVLKLVVQTRAACCVTQTDVNAGP